MEDIKIKHGPAQIIAGLTAVAMILASLGIGATTVSGALPAGVDPNIGVWAAGIAGLLGAFSTALYAFTRFLNANLHLKDEGGKLADAPPAPAQLPAASPPEEIEAPSTQPTS
jgi:hypothetical protein